MMEGIISLILNMSLTGSVVILLVMAVRLALRRFPKIFSYVLWAVVLFRLLCPVSLAAPVSLVGALRPEVQASTAATSRVSYIPATVVRPLENRTPVEPQFRVDNSQAVRPAEPKAALNWMQIGFALWLTGAAAMAGCGFVQYLRLRRRLVGAVPYRGDVYLSDYVDTPFVLGVLRPRAYLPSAIPQAQRRFIIAHERCHIRRGDPLWKLLGYAALCVHWFNPLVWAAFSLAGKDMEMSCDEAVIRQLGEINRADYAETLLRLATHRKRYTGMPLAFGEGDTRSRVKNMARWKKPSRWATVLCVVLCLVILAACGLNPKAQGAREETPEVSGPASIEFGQLHFELPEGLSYRMRENGRGDDHNVILSMDGVISDGTREVGGVMAFPVPAGLEILDWMRDLPLEEWQDDTLGYSGGGSLEDRFTLEFFSDVPPGVEQTLLRRHELMQNPAEPNYLYDLWLDELVLPEETRNAICNTMGFGGSVPSSPQSALPFAVLDLPEGFAYSVENGRDILFTRDGAPVGGITSYPIPENAYDPFDDFFLWLEKMGIPDYHNPELQFSGGITGRYDGWNVQFNTPDGKAYRTHLFIPAGDVVYDFWMNAAALDIGEQFDLEDAVVYLGGGLSHTADAGDPEERAFAMCTAVMDQLEWSSFQIHREFRYENQPERNYSEDCYNSETEAMALPTPASAGALALLSTGDRFYTNAGNEYAEGPVWHVEEREDFEYMGPWLTSFHLAKKYVTYQDTLGGDDGEWIIFQANVPFGTEPDGSPDYLIEFLFDPDGNFVKVQLHVNSFEEDACVITESIVTLDETIISQAIAAQSSRIGG